MSQRALSAVCSVRSETEGHPAIFYRPGLSQIIPAEPGETERIKRHKSLPPKQRRKSGLNVSERGAGTEGRSSYYYGNSDTDNRPSEVNILSSPAECFIHNFIFHLKSRLCISRNNYEIYLTLSQPSPV